MRRSVFSRDLFSSGTAILIWLAGTKLLLHFGFSGNYGYFRDELYYIACGKHLAWGYVDQAPLIAVVARFSRAFLGDSLFGIRFFPAVSGAFLVFLTGWMAGELGGGRFAQFLAATAILLAPAYLAFDSFLSMNALEPVFWMVCAYLVIRILKGADARLWLLFGAVAGVGLLNKQSMLVFGFAVVVGLLPGPERRQLRSKWIWLGGLAAVAIFLPNLIWEAQHGWPQFEVVRNSQKFKNYPVSPVRYIFDQILFLHPVALPVWIAGLAWYFTSKEGKPFRCLGWAFVVVLGIYMLLKGKTYYPIPAYPMLMAAGGVASERFVRSAGRQWLAFAYPGVLLLSGLATLPFGVPVLPVGTFVRYSEILPMARPVKIERDPMGPLPQLYADMFGWENMVATVARVYHSLPAEEQAKCAILTGNYGEAGAIDFFGGKYGLPKALSGHNSYFLWGPRGYSGEVVILFGDRAEEMKQMFGEVERAATIVSPYAMPVESNLAVYVCRKPHAPLSQLWPRVKLFI